MERKAIAMHQSEMAIGERLASKGNRNGSDARSGGQILGVAERWDESWRRECEAREWLRRTGGKGEAVRELLKRIEAKRGAEAAEVLRQDMRKAFQAARSGAATR